MAGQGTTKRKMDGALETSGDGKALTHKVPKRSCGGSTAAAGGDKAQRSKEFIPSSHVGTAYIGDRMHQPSSGEAPGTFNAFHFNCPLGDTWLDRYPLYDPSSGKCKNRRRLKVSTGDSEANTSLGIMKDSGYQPQMVLSKGHFSSVILASSKVHQKDVVVKFLLPDKRGRSAAARKNSASSLSTDCHPDSPATPTNINEVLLRQPLKHENVVEMYDHLIVKKRHVLVLHFCQNGSLEDMLAAKRKLLLPEPVVRRYLEGIVCGVEYLHQQSICHCDISCSNILLDTHDRPKITDFSRAKRYPVGSPLCTDYPAVTPYQPPEVVLQNEPYDPHKLDVYALGIAMYRLLTNSYLFGEKRLQMAYRFYVIPPNMDTDTYVISEKAQDFLWSTVSFNANERPSASTLRIHPWLKSCNKKVSIGYHYLVRQPRRDFSSPSEMALKELYEL